MIYSSHSDTVVQCYPWRVFTDNMLAEGQLPLWLPYTFSGEPHIANMQTAIFYPINIIIFSIFPTYLAFGYSFFIHIFLAGLFMYIFMRYIKLDRFSSFLSSIIFMFSQHLIAHTYAGHHAAITTACWLPLIFLLFEIALNKKSLFYGLLIGIPIGLQFLAGHLQYSFYTLIALGLYLVFRSLLIIKKNRDYKKVVKLVFTSALALLVGVSLSAIQLIPSFELSQHITRTGGVSYEFATFLSFPLQNFITFLLPNFYGNPVDGSCWGFLTYWELSIYVGILTLILILFAIYFKRNNKYVLFFTGLAFFSFLLALGSNTPVYWFFWKFIPGFNMILAPVKILILFAFSASILAGFGFNFITGKLTEKQREKIWKFIKTLTVACILLAFILIGVNIVRDRIFEFAENFVIESYTPNMFFSIDYYLNKIPLTISNFILDLLILLVLCIVSIAILVLFLKLNLEKSFKFKYFNLKLKNILKIIVILFILSNLWLYNISFIQTKNPEEIYSKPDFVEFLMDNSEGYRVYIYKSGGKIPSNFQIIYGIYTIRGYNPVQLQDYWEVIKCVHNLSDNQNHPILNLLNVKYIITSTQINNSGFKLVFNKNNTYIYENEQVLPRAFVVYNVTVKPEEDVIKELKNESFNPIDSLILEGKTNATITSNEGFEKVEIREYSPNKIILRANITQPGFLVLSEVYYPGWNAYVDGEEQEIHKAYHTLRAINLDAGLHTVTFSYDPNSLRMGLWLTLFTSIFLVIILTIKITSCLGVIKMRRITGKDNDFKEHL